MAPLRSAVRPSARSSARSSGSTPTDPNAYQITHGVADDLIRDLTAEGSLLRMHHFDGHVSVRRSAPGDDGWSARSQEAGVTRDRRRGSDRLSRSAIAACSTSSLRRASARVRVKANGYVDSSGDASLSYEAGLRGSRARRRRSSASLNFLIENYDLDTVRRTQDDGGVRAPDRASAHKYGLVRHDGWLMHFPGKNFMLANISHFETPLDPLADARTWCSRAGARRTASFVFLRAEFRAHLCQCARARVRQSGHAPDALDRQAATN